MNIVGLKGFSKLGQINQYFTSGFFPDKWDWTIQDVTYIVQEYKRYLLRTKPTTEDYILICYSDGGLPGHILAALDPLCKGIISHSATFAEGPVDDAFWTGKCANTNIVRLQDRDKIPVLLIENLGDKTKWMPSWYGRTKQAYEYYTDNGYPTEYHTLPRTTWHGHEFNNAFGIMNAWAKNHFSIELPIK